MALNTQSSGRTGCGLKRRLLCINDIVNETRGQLYAVITSVIKEPTLNKNNNNYSALIAISDPSCLAPAASRKDILVHIFFNRRLSPKFAVPLTVGDIVYLPEIKGDLYRDKVHCIVYNSNLVVQYPGGVSDPVKPYTNNDKFAFDKDFDSEQVTRLRQWWQENKSQFDEEIDLSEGTSDGRVSNRKNNCPVNDSLQVECILSEITEESTFSIYCQILNVREMVFEKGKKVVILKIQDGSVTSKGVLVIQRNLEDTTQDLSTQTGFFSECVKSVYISVYKPYEDAALLRPNAFVYLRHVRSCYRMKEQKIIDFVMDGDNCAIHNISEKHSQILKIQRRLKGKNMEESMEDSGGTSLIESSRQELRNVNDDPTDSREYEDSRSGRGQEDSQGSGQHGDSQGASVERNKQKQFVSPYRPASKLLKICTKDAHRPVVRGGNIALQPSAAQLIIKNTDGSTTSIEDCAIEKSSEPFCIETFGDLEEEKVDRFMLRQVRLDRVYKVHATVRNIYVCLKTNGDIIADKPHLCDCVWGFCVVCHTLLSSDQIRKGYAAEDLRHSGTALPCLICRSRNSDSDGHQEHEEAEAVIPLDDQRTPFKAFMRFDVILVDPRDSYNIILAELSGDNAQVFFGLPATFSWLLDASQLAELIDGLIGKSWHLGLEQYFLRSGRFCNIIRNCKLRKVGSP